MKKNVLCSFAACSAMLLPGITANAQETVVVEESIMETEVPCKNHYYSTSKDNWFIQVGAGVASPFVENAGGGHGHFTANYNLAFGKYISPYLGWRISFLGGALHNNPGTYQKFKYVNANVDFMWDMLNSMGGVNTKRVFSIVPFVGLGGTFGWDYRPDGTIMGNDGKPKGNVWALPVSAGIQFNFRLCKYVDFFLEGRGQFYGDNLNNIPGGRPVDINLTATSLRSVAMTSSLTTPVTILAISATSTIRSMISAVLSQLQAQPSQQPKPSCLAPKFRRLS